MRNCTWPVTFQLRYWPRWKEDTVRLSSTFPVDGSITSIRSARPPCQLSQSSRYSETVCARPSVALTSTVKLVALYQVAAMRSDAPAFCRARTSEVDGAQV